MTVTTETPDLLREEYLRGYEDGLEEGREAGWEEGHDHGHQDGMTEGLNFAADRLHEANLSALLGDLAEIIADYAEASGTTLTMPDDHELRLRDLHDTLHDLSRIVDKMM